MILSAYVAHINILSIIVAGITYFALGALWYSPVLFGKVWGKLQNRDLSTIGKKDMVTSMITSFLVTFIVVATAGLFCFALGANSILGGLKVGLALGIGIMAATYAINFAYSGKKPALYFIEVGYQLVAITLVSVILAVW